MLAYSVFSLRLSEDVPSQSDSVHLISLYLTVCMFFSLSAMTWFAIVNKLREKKRLPYWLRWLALDYISWIVFATSMHRKAVRAVKQKPLKTSPITPSTSVIIPLQPTTTETSPTEFSNTSYFERDSLSAGSCVRVPLLSSKSSRAPSAVEQAVHPSSLGLVPCNAVPADESDPLRSHSPSTVWIRRRLTNLPSLNSSSNGPSNKKTAKNSSAQSQLTRLLYEQTPAQNKESLYAIQIYNRLVFMIFLVVVFVINIYTWFFYSRSVKTKLLDDRTPWTCYDESRLEIVNCRDLFWDKQNNPSK